MTKILEDKIYMQGFNAFHSSVNWTQVNPYNQIEDRGMGIQALQPEATWFFNGWEAARKRFTNEIGYFLFLDDVRFPDWVTWERFPKINCCIARHYQEFIYIIDNNGLPEFVSFDFDLDRHNLTLDQNLFYGTGLDCAQWLIDYCKRNKFSLPKWGVHSTNSTEAPKIVKCLTDFKG